MSQYIKDSDGNVHRVGENTKVTRDALVDTFKKAEELLQKANQDIVEFDALNAVPETAEEEATPAEQAQDIAEDAAELAADLAGEEASAPEAPVDTPVAPTAEPAPVAPVAPTEPVAPAPTPEQVPEQLVIQ